MKKSIAICKLMLISALSIIPQGPIVSRTPNDNLVSPTTGIDYGALAALLNAGRWRDANNETNNLLLKATGRESQGWYSTEHLGKLACWDLKTLDNLWREASKGRFGFTAQFPIFVKAGNRPGGLVTVETYQLFGDRVGWRKNNDWIIFKENLDYSLNAPIGHLPSLRSEYQISGGRLDYSTLVARLVTCKVVGTK